MARTFEDREAIREKVPLMIGLMGPSGGGKTYSALRLAGGIQRVTGGDIYMIDTEAKRGLHYADKFKFRHVPFGAPFGSLDYLEAVQYCAGKGAGVIIVDSMSHEHEGPGGLLEKHEAELNRLAGDDYKRRKSMSMLAWAKPKQERRRLINTLLQLPVNFIFCFRAKEKIKMVKGDDPQQMGFMPIAGEEFVFEMTANCLLLPNAGGVPTWDSGELGERLMIKLPEQFKAMFRESVPLSEQLGQSMAQWAAGSPIGTVQSASSGAHYEELIATIAKAMTLTELDALVPSLANIKETRSMPSKEYNALRAAWGAKKKQIEEQGGYSDAAERDAIAEAS